MCERAKLDRRMPVLTDTRATRIMAHSDLARDAVVAQAIAEVLRTGETARLQNKWTSNGKAEARISDTQLRRTHSEKVDFAHMEPEARQAFLRNLNEPPQLKLSVPATTAKRPAAARRVPPKTRKTSARVRGGAKPKTTKRLKGNGSKAAKRAPVKRTAVRKAALQKPRAASRVVKPSRRRPSKSVTTRRNSPK